MQTIDINYLLSGNWTGDWGTRKDVPIRIDVNGEKYMGHYILDGKKIEFSGSLKKQVSQIVLTFLPPMSNNSGGYFDYKKERLILFCEDISGTFVKQEM